MSAKVANVRLKLKFYDPEIEDMTLEKVHRIENLENLSSLAPRNFTWNHFLWKFFFQKQSSHFIFQESNNFNYKHTSLLLKISTLYWNLYSIPKTNSKTQTWWICELILTCNNLEIRCYKILSRLIHFPKSDID